MLLLLMISHCCVALRFVSIHHNSTLCVRGWGRRRRRGQGGNTAMWSKAWNEPNAGRGHSGGRGSLGGGRVRGCCYCRRSCRIMLMSLCCVINMNDKLWQKPLGLESNQRLNCQEIERYHTLGFTPKYSSDHNKDFTVIERDLKKRPKLLLPKDVIQKSTEVLKRKRKSIMYFISCKHWKIVGFQKNKYLI